MAATTKKTDVQEIAEEVSKEAEDREQLMKDLKDLFPDGHYPSRREIRRAEKQLRREQKEKAKAEKKAAKSARPNIFQRNEGIIVSGMLGLVGAIGSAALAVMASKNNAPTINLVSAEGVEVKDLPESAATIPATPVEAVHEQ